MATLSRNRKFKKVLVIGLVMCLPMFYYFGTSGHLTLGPINAWSEQQNKGCPNSAVFHDACCRFGNVFFEYLTAKVFAEELNRTLYIPRDLSDLFTRYFFSGQRAPSFGNFQILKELCNIDDWNMTGIDMNGLSHINASQLASHSYIKLSTGYPDYTPPDLWKVFLSRRHEFLREFQWIPELKYEIQDLISMWTSNFSDYTVLVGVHVRMQDYHQHMNNMYGPSKIPGEAYFNKTLGYYRRKYGSPVFLVVSNDMDYCRDTIQGTDVIFAGNGDEGDPGRDLALLSSCDHLILTYGSYGLTAAYFLRDGGEVLAADNFTTRPNAMSENVRHSGWPNWTWIGVD